jgi:hypothetical protein
VCWGAFADKRRIVTADEYGGVSRRACASLVASFAAGVPLLVARPSRCVRGWRRVEGWPRGDAKRSSSPIGRCGSADTPRQSVAWPPNALRFPPVDQVRQAGAGDSLFALACPSQPSVAPRPGRYAAFADERRVVADDAGGRVRTRNAHPRPRIATRRPIPRRVVGRVVRRGLQVVRLRGASKSRTSGTIVGVLESRRIPGTLEL